MKRLIFGMLAFSLTFGISVVLVGLVSGFPELSQKYSGPADSRVVRNITFVLDQDMRVGDRRRFDEIRVRNGSGNPYDEAAMLSDPEYADAIGKYSTGASYIDVSKTPADFQYAWTKHMKAWDAHTKAIEGFDKTKTKRAGIYKTSAEINSTWRQVLRIADRYGVTIKPRYLE